MYIKVVCVFSGQGIDGYAAIFALDGLHILGVIAFALFEVELQFGSGGVVGVIFVVHVRRPVLSGGLQGSRRAIRLPFFGCKDRSIVGSGNDDSDRAVNGATDFLACAIGMTCGELDIEHVFFAVAHVEVLHVSGVQLVGVGAVRMQGQRAELAHNFHRVIAGKILAVCRDAQQVVIVILVMPYNIAGSRLCCIFI